MRSLPVAPVSPSQSTQPESAATAAGETDSDAHTAPLHSALQATAGGAQVKPTLEGCMSVQMLPQAW